MLRLLWIRILKKSLLHRSLRSESLIFILSSSTTSSSIRIQADNGPLGAVTMNVTNAHMKMTEKRQKNIFNSMRTMLGKPKSLSNGKSCRHMVHNTQKLPNDLCVLSIDLCRLCWPSHEMINNRNVFFYLSLGIRKLTINFIIIL